MIKQRNNCVILLLFKEHIRCVLTYKCQFTPEALALCLTPEIFYVMLNNYIFQVGT